MPKITLIAKSNCFISGVTGAADVFAVANLQGAATNELESPFDIQIASVSGQPVSGFGNLQITPHISIGGVDDTDFILIPGLLPMFDLQSQNSRTLIKWLRDHYNKGTLIGSVCTGAFMLAETGLLDGKAATTNWQFKDLFKQSYPDVDLQIQRLIVEDRGLVSSGAATAYLDLCLYIIEKFSSKDLAASCSKSLLINPNRKAQSPYMIFSSQKNHGDTAILDAQKWMEDYYSNVVLIDEIAEKFGMSPRNFKRRFKNATGDTPINYLQRVRIESAKKQFETTRKTVSEITYTVGYEDSNSFRKLFKKYTSLSPNVYRKRFSRISRAN